MREEPETDRIPGLGCLIVLLVGVGLGIAIKQANDIHKLEMAIEKIKTELEERKSK